MEYTTVAQVVQAIAPHPLEEMARQGAHEQWAAVAKPLGSLGQLEIVLEEIAALTGNKDICINPRTLLVFCADNGVVFQGVTQCGQEVTTTLTQNVGLQQAIVCRLAHMANCEVIGIDMGVTDFPPSPGVRNCRCGNGTQDMTQGPAMTREQAEKAILTGVSLAKEQAKKGTRLLLTGEMGIGNTTTSSAVASVLLGMDSDAMTGRGAGLSDEGLQRKRRAIRQAILTNQPDPLDPVDVLSKVGGFDLCGICGAFLGGALYGIPVLIDGFISAVGALCAMKLCPQAQKAMIASHVSAEPAGKLMLDVLGKTPLITAGMRLGEGSGAVAALPLLDMACTVYGEALSFHEANIQSYVPLS